VGLYDAAVLTIAARNGHLEAVQYLHPFVQADPRVSGACVVAAQFDHANTLKWLISEAGHPITHAVLTAAARGGSLPVLQWLYQQMQQQPATGTAAFDEFVVVCAIKDGHLAAVECLAHGKGAQCYHFAAAHGHTDILFWLREHSIECDTAKLCVSAAQSGCVGTIEYALELHTAVRGDAPPQLLTVSWSTLTALMG
jgi:ankyrin repeat protein